MRRGARIAIAIAMRAVAACARTPGARGGKPNVWKDRTNPNAVTAIAFGG